MEIWKDVVGYEGFYEVSNLGRVKSLSNRWGRKCILKAFCNRGYSRVLLCNKNERKSFYIHRLMLEAFVGKCPNGMEGGHINGVATDNRVKNLKWCTKKENADDKMKHGTVAAGESHGAAKLKEQQVREIYRIRQEEKISCKKISKMFNVCEATVFFISKGWTWKCLNLKGLE